MAYQSTRKFNSALLRCFDAEQTDDVSLESALAVNQVVEEETEVIIDADDDHQFQVVSIETEEENVTFNDIENTIVIVRNETDTKFRVFFWGYSEKQHVKGGNVNTLGQMVWTLEHFGVNKDTKIFVSDLSRGRGYYSTHAASFGTDSWTRLNKQYKLRQL